MEGRPNGPGASRPLSLVIPAYNEEAVIAQAIQEADEALARFDREYEILVVDDGSSDNTAAVAAAAARQRPHVHLLRHDGNRGYSAALRTGFEAARYERVAFTDADCQFDLADLAPLLQLSDHFPLAVGYRVDRQDPAQRRFFSWGYNLLVRGLFGTRVRDCDCALKVFRKDALARLLPQTDGFFVNTEMLARARQLGYPVAEVGVRHRPRPAGASKVSLRDIPRTLATLVPFWWSRILFVGTGPARTSPARPPARWLPVILLTLLVGMAGLLFFSRLGCPLLEPDEARHAEIPRQMLTGGHIIPVLHGEPYYQMPPLLYWLVLASYRLFGVHDWAARLIPSAAAFLTVLVVYGWGRRTLGHRAGFLGALILCLSAPFVYFGRMLTPDSLFCLWVVAALAAAHRALQDGGLRRGWWLLSAGCCGLGLLTQGPAVLVLVGGPVLAYLALDRRAVRPGWRMGLAYAVTVLGLAGPWYVLAARQDPAFFGTINAVRSLAVNPPVWYYLPGFLLGLLPWALLLPPFLRFLGRRSAVQAARRPSALGFFLLSFLFSLAVFSLAAQKQTSSLQAAFPPLALALGCYLDAVLPRQTRAAGYAVLLWSRGRLARRATLVVLALGGCGGLLAAAAGLWKPALGLVLAGLAAGGGGWLARTGGDRPRSSWALCGATTFALLFIGVHQLLPSYARQFSLRGEVRPHRALAGDPHFPVFCYPHGWDSVSFYLRRGDVRVFTPARRGQLVAALQRRPGALVFVQSDRGQERPLTDLLRALPPSMEFVPSRRQGTVTAGIVRQRQSVPEFLVAEK
jgi:dolichol-phosphate mannosyltransferase